MGLVYRVYHRGWNTHLAVKSPRQEHFQTEPQKENFIRECETWINLGLHPHIVSCYYVRKLGGIPRVFAEYVQGGSLKEWIDSRRLYEGGPYGAPKRVLDIAIQMAWGLQHAHMHGVIHQDVKPANVMMLSDGTAKVTDFGLAKARAATGETLAGDEPRSILVSSGGMTPAYCSPEQAEIAAMRKAGQAEERIPKLTQRTDIWSWGVSVLEMLYGGPPCPAGGQAAGEVLEAFLSTPPDVGALPAISREMAELMRACFQQNPASRPEWFGVLVDRLKEIYRKQTDEDYARIEPSAVRQRADGLNNQAVSLVDLGREDDALEVFQQALHIEPGHLEVIYNQGLTLWRGGRTTDQEILLALNGADASQAVESRRRYLLGLVHLERDDRESALRELEAAGGEHGSVEVLHALRRAQLAEEGGRCLQVFECPSRFGIRVAMSPNCRWALTTSEGLPCLWNLATGRFVRSFEVSGCCGCVAVSPDGRWGLAGSADNTLHLLELATGRCIRTIKGHTGEVFSVAVSSDGCWGLSASGDHTLRLWDLRTGECLRKFETFLVVSVAFSPDGQQALSGSENGELVLWDLASGQRVRGYDGHEDNVPSVAISPDGQLGLSGSVDRTLRLWLLATGRCVRTFKGHTNWVSSVAFSSDGCWGLSASGDHTLRLWELTSGRCLRTLEGHTAGVTSVAVSALGRWALSGAGDQTLRVWALPSARVMSPYVVSRPSATEELGKAASQFRSFMQDASEALPRGMLAQAASAIRSARCCAGHDVDEEALDAWARVGRFGLRMALPKAWCIRTFAGHTDRINSVAISPDGNRGLSGSGDKTLRLWELATGQCIRIFEGHTDAVLSVAISPDGLWALSGSEDGSRGERARLWALTSGQGTEFEVDVPNAAAVAISPDGRWCLVGGGCDTSPSFATLELWKLESGACHWAWGVGPDWLHELATNTHVGESAKTYPNVGAVAWAPDGRWCLSGDADWTVMLWDLVSEEPLRKFEGHTKSVRALAIAASGRRFLSGSDDGSLRLWEVATGRCEHICEGHAGPVLSVAITPDDRWCVSGGADRTIRVWDLVTGQSVQILKGHTDAVRSVAISPGGRRVLSGSVDGTLRLWELDWEYEFPAAADGHDGARSYLEVFLTLKCLVTERGVNPAGAPCWSQQDFENLLTQLQHRGYGWLRPEGVRRQLEKMAAGWQGPPPMPGVKSK